MCKLIRREVNLLYSKYDPPVWKKKTHKGHKYEWLGPGWSQIHKLDLHLLPWNYTICYLSNRCLPCLMLTSYLETVVPNMFCVRFSFIKFRGICFSYNWKAANNCPLLGLESPLLCLCDPWPKNKINQRWTLLVIILNYFFICHTIKERALFTGVLLFLGMAQNCTHFFLGAVRTWWGIVQISL